MKLEMLLFSFVINVFYVSAQVGIGTTSPNTSAKLEISSTTQGFLPPRMTVSQRAAIANPADASLFQSEGYLAWIGAPVTSVGKLTAGSPTRTPCVYRAQ